MYFAFDAIEVLLDPLDCVEQRSVQPWDNFLYLFEFTFGSFDI